jgi:DNA gyrase/topoisomerase IV subunit B
MRDPNNLDSVLKTDLSTAKIEQDISEAARYGLKSMLAPKKKTEQDIFNEAMNAATPAQRMTLAWAHAQKKSKPKKQFLPPSWQSGRK